MRGNARDSTSCSRRRSRPRPLVNVSVSFRLPRSSHVHPIQRYLPPTHQPCRQSPKSKIRSSARLAEAVLLSVSLSMSLSYPSSSPLVSSRLAYFPSSPRCCWTSSPLPPLAFILVAVDVLVVAAVDCRYRQSHIPCSLFPVLCPLL